MEIVNQDALSYMDSLKDEMFDLVVLDPDYQDWDKHIESGIIEKSIRLLKKTGNIICFTKQPFDYNLRQKVNPYFRREIVWTFNNGGAWVSNKMPLVSSQKIYWLTKTKDFYFNPRTGVQYSDSTKDFKRTTKVFGDYCSEGRNFVRSSEGVWLRDHLHYNKPNTGKIPSKPEELINILLTCFCQSGGTILDPFCGYGTIPKCANNLSMDCYASEIDSERVFALLDKLFIPDGGCS